mgnify:CR=1 FL=1
MYVSIIKFLLKYNNRNSPATAKKYHKVSFSRRPFSFIILFVCINASSYITFITRIRGHTEEKASLLFTVITFYIMIHAAD